MTTVDLYDILCIGNYTKDTIVTPAGVAYVDGGAVNYAAHAAVALGAKVAVVTHLAREDQRVVDKFLQDGIDCFPMYTPHSTNMHLDYPTTNPDIRTLTVTHTAGSITAEELENLNARTAVIGSSLRGEVGLDVVMALKAMGMTVAADVQGYVRVLRGTALANEPWEEMAETLAHVDILKSDAVEAESLTGRSNIHQAALAFAEMGPKEIVLTHKGGLLVFAEGLFYERQFHPLVLNGRSGRGDTCLGAYATARLTMPPVQASTWAAALTSLKMEKQGPFNRSKADIEALIQEKYS